MGKLLRLHVSDFKSYKGTQVIGPFHKYTAILGPNGAGKSNLMDAISFVVGVETKQLRGALLKDLVYNADGRRDELKREASVTLIYLPSEGELQGFGENDELRFERMITHTGVCKYRLNGRTVTKLEYDNQLKDIGVLAKARNFLVFQGDVESIASKSPTELTRFFEDISSSAELIKEYETLKEKKEKAETDTIFTYRQKKGISQERKQAREQKLEAERFNKKLEELKMLRTNLFLMQLFQIEEDIEAKREEIKNLESEVAEASHKENVAEVLVEEKKKDEARARKAANVAEKHARSLRSKLATLEPAAVKAREVVRHHERRIKIEQSAIEKAESERHLQEQEIAGLSSDIEKMKEAEKSYAQKLSEAENSSTISKEQLEELQAIKESARSKNIALRAGLETEQRGFDVTKERLTSLQRNVNALIERKENIESEGKSFKGREERLAQAIRSLKEDVRVKESELASKREEFATLRAQRQDLESKLERATAKLREAKAYRSESHKERKLTEFLASLKGHFPGVKGRLVDLCTPSSRRYELAITVALGRQMDSIVVDKESTGFSCINFMRERRAGKATFLPLDSIEPKRTQERHRLLGPNYKLAVDVLEFDESLSRAIQYALAGVVICETLEDARELCFKRREKVKAVTLDGHVISTNGDMTGGSSQGSRQNRFEQKELEAARRSRDELRRDLESLDDRLFEIAGHQSGVPGRRAAASSETTVRRRELLGGGAIQTLEVNLANSENRLKFADMELVALREKLDKYKNESEAIERELTRVQPKVDELKATLKEKQAALSALQSQGSEAENVLIDEYGKRIGMPKIREVLEATLAEKNKLAGSLVKIREQLDKLNSQLRYAESRNPEKVLELATKKLVTLQAGLEKKVKASTEADEMLNVARESLQEAEAEVDAKIRDADSKQVEAKEVAKAWDEVLMVKAQLMRKLTGAENAVEKLRARRHEVLREAERDQVDIPIVGRKPKSRKKSKKAREAMDVDEGPEEDEDDDDNADDDDNDDDDDNSKEDSLTSDSVAAEKRLRSSDSQGSEPSSLGFSNSDSGTVRRDERASAKVDFSSLDQQDTANEDRPAVLSSYRERIRHLEEELEKMEPNMKATERFESVTERLKNTDEMLLKARQESREVDISFDDVKQRRYDKFMHMYEHVSQSIDSVYRDLTKSEKHPLGGNAYLSIDRTDEPYLGGIKYNAMPPTKRFRDMDQLSGGEKTVAALALLFAVHSYHKAPFFVMDECDAALDAANVHKVSSYLQRNSGDFQCIVISLKDTFYDKADALVGIYREQKDNCSRTLTLDLTPYDDQDSAAPPMTSSTTTAA